MPNSYFQFKEFRISQKDAGMKVTTDACLFGAWVADEVANGWPDQPVKVLDIGAGTGLLSLMIAQQNSQARITAVEKDPLAAAEAAANFSASPWNERLECLNQPIQAFKGRYFFDIIVSNPPFFKRHQLGRGNQKNQALHDDSLPMPELVASLKRFRKSTGTCFILYPKQEMINFQALLSAEGLLLGKMITVRNQKDGNVFREMGRFSEEDASLSSELIIRQKNNHYSNDFWKLLSPYYLAYNNPMNKGENPN